MVSSTFKIPTAFKDDVMDNIILPYCRKNIEFTVKAKTGWTVASNFFYVLSTITLATAGIVAFAASTYPNEPLGFYTGMLIVVSGALEKFSVFSVTQDHLKTIKSNTILSNMGINFSFIDTSSLEGGSESQNKDESKN